MHVLIDLKNKNLYHMDIKPVNILMKDKIIDKIEDATNIDSLLKRKRIQTAYSH